MIYTASLAIPVRKALGKQVMQSNLNKICDQLGLDPDISGMDVVVFGPQDLAGPKAVKVQTAMQNKHPGICVIYLYQKSADADIIDTEYTKQCRKVTPQIVNEVFDEFVGEHQIRQGKQRMTSADFDKDPDIPMEPKKKGKPGRRGKKNQEPEESYMEEDYGEEDFGPRVGVPVQEEVQDAAPSYAAPPIVSQPEPMNVEQEPAQHTAQIVEMDTDPPAPGPLDPEFISRMNAAAQQTVASTSQRVSDPAPIPKPVETTEEVLSKVTSYEDWMLFKEHLHHDSIVKSLIAENSEYLGLIQMLDVLDKRIATVWRDTGLSPDQKFDKIKEIGLERAVVRASTNSMNVDKLIRVISSIVLSAKRTVEEKVESVDVALYKIAADQNKLMDTSYIDQAIEKRTKVQIDLFRISRDIVDLYKSIDNLVVSEIEELDRHLPSSNQFVNDMVKPIGTQIFTPSNTAVLANKLMRALQENSIVASQLEEMVNTVIENLFELCEKDEEIIRYQQNMIDMMRANRVEDVIITDTLLKTAMRIYTGADNTGRSATAITWCGILSRRHNSLLIDLTGRAKFREYGITPMRLDDFMSSRPEKQFLCVESDHVPNAEELQKIIEDLKSRLNYYPYVNVIMAPEDEAGIAQMSDEALCIHYVTDCSTSSISYMRDVIQRHKTKNIARKLVIIDTPVSPLIIADSLGVDPTLVKVISLPAVNAIRACSLRHDRPYEYTDIVRVYEEAFR